LSLSSLLPVVLLLNALSAVQIEDCYRKTLPVDDVVTSLDILDTAGQEDFSALRDQWVREGNGFVLVYSITNRQSFRDLALFRERILLVNDEREVNAPM
jgi:GTPase KRas